MTSRRQALALLLPLCAVAHAHARELTRDFLSGAHPLDRPVAMSEYTPPSGQPPLHHFEGRLRLSHEGSAASINVLRDDYDVARTSGAEIIRLPDFDFELIQEGDALIPVQRGSIPASHTYWEYILEPGRVWSEPEDGGWSRASLPFALMERNANCLHNGVLTFLFDGAGEVSRAAYQISVETCAYFKADLWGVLPAQYSPQAVRNREAVAAAHAREVAARLPVKPIEALAADHPGAQPDQFGAGDEIPELTAFGFVIDGIHYAGGCQTRHGPYPYCDVLSLPSYSLAKSVFAGLAAMRLERLYPGLLRQRIADYVPECRDRKRWGGVTFEQALDMATGNYTSPVHELDEDSAETLEFFLAEDHASKIRIACRLHPRRAAPGSRWVYHTTDTYILGSALSSSVRQRMGQSADLYRDTLVQPLWRALELSPVLDVTRRTYDTRAQPFTGWGLVLHRDDIVRIAQFLNSERGRLNGKAFFDERSFAAAMQLDPSDRGLPATAGSRYNNGFWARDVSAQIGCQAEVWTPYLLGYGGITVLMMPNDTVYYYFSDGGVFRWNQALAASHRIRSLCGASS